mgnify:CR=1 FL=1
MKLDLPDDRELLLWLRRNGLRIDRGQRRADPDQAPAAVVLPGPVRRLFRGQDS